MLACVFGRAQLEEGHTMETPAFNLPDNVAEALAPVFAALPLDQSMRQLVVRQGATPEQRTTVQEALNHPALFGRPGLAAGLWLYIDELDRSHDFSQSMHDSTGSFWHGIMHRREGDFGNSRYWFAKVGNHPALARIPGYKPDAFIEDVSRLDAAQRHTGAPERLVALQRAEWCALFQHCAVEE